MCDKLGLDVWEVVGAAATKPYGFMPFYPGPGLGGHCIPIDPHYLSWKLRTLNYTARFIELAAEVNSHMPEHVMGKITDALNSKRKALNGSHILILGAAYKPNIGDMRESPALDIIHLLLQRGAEALATADCVVIVTDHDTYDWAWIADQSQLLVDTRNAVVKNGREHIVRL
jgi:UDP-N-acetyl-D-glucosamine dehydrogenase